jgi:hypothetical protein
MDPEQRAEILRQLETMGAPAVRALLSAQKISPEHVYLAAKVVSDSDAAERARNEASQAEQIDLARSAKDAAWQAAHAAQIANRIAAAALIAAVIAIVVAVISLVRSH